MRILEDHQNRMLGCQFGCLCSQRFQRSLSALLRGKVEQGIAVIVRSDSIWAKSAASSIEVEVCSSTAFELVKPRLRCVVMRQSRGIFPSGR